MTPDDFISRYQAALASQDWSNIEPLVAEDACVTFSNGTVHEGRTAVKAAFTRNFSLIKNERYEIQNPRWIRRGDSMAVLLFDFAWRGIINGQGTAGAGRGTHVLVRDRSEWKLLVEHLGPKAS